MTPLPLSPSAEEIDAAIADAFGLNAKEYAEYGTPNWRFIYRAGLSASKQVESRCIALEKVLAELVAKLDEVTPIITGMSLRCYGPTGYTGPTYAVELVAARAILEPRS